MLDLRPASRENEHLTLQDNEEDILWADSLHNACIMLIIVAKWLLHAATDKYDDRDNSKSTTLVRSLLDHLPSRKSSADMMKFVATYIDARMLNKSCWLFLQKQKGKK